MPGPMYACLAEYTTPHAPDVDETSRLRHDGAFPQLASLIAARGVSGAAIERALAERDTQGAQVLLRAPRIDWTLCAPWVTIVRTGSGEVLRWALRQPRLVELAGRGHVVKEAVRTNFAEALQRLLELPHVDPNLGGALHLAVTQADLAALKTICAHPKLAINAFTPARGTTALCQAIVMGYEQVFCFLLAHPRIDVNRGFLFTPLQLCVLENRPSFARLLLSRPALLVNKSPGGTQPPLWLALDAENREIALLLLRDSRVNVSDGLIDRLESRNDADSLQLICDVDGQLRWGKTWRARRASALATVACQWLSGISDLVATIAAARVGLPTLAVLLLLVHAMSAAAGAALLSADRRERPRSFLRAVPFFPLLETAASSFMCRARSVAARSDAARTMHRCVAMEFARTALVVLVLLGFVQRLGQSRALGSSAAISCVAHLLSIVVALRLWSMRETASGPARGYARLA